MMYDIVFLQLKEIKNQKQPYRTSEGKNDPNKNPIAFLL